MIQRIKIHFMKKYNTSLLTIVYPAKSGVICKQSLDINMIF